MDLQLCNQRRHEFNSRLGSGVAILPAASAAIRSNDVDYRYRPSNDLLFLTGFSEPESICVLAPNHPEHPYVLFVRPRDPDREQWDGPRAGVERAVSAFGAAVAFPIAEFEQRLPSFLRGSDQLFYRLGFHEELDRVVVRALRAVRSEARKGAAVPWVVSDPTLLLGEMRLRKSDADLAHLRKAAEITAEAHVRAIAATQPGRFEFEIEAELLSTFRKRKAEAGYEPIVASGPNATILHYRDNRALMQNGQLLLIDAGAEIDWYTADVTRTFPVGRRFSAEQRAVYDLVLEAQRIAIQAVRPRETLEHIHSLAVDVIVRGLIDLKLISGNPSEVVEKGLYKRFYMHRTSHWLGMDVHDVGAYFIGGQPRPLEPGMVLTVEPGVYVPESSDVDHRWGGIGVRIEDDILVTSTGHEILTSAIPKDAVELEAMKRDQPLDSPSENNQVF